MRQQLAQLVIRFRRTLILKYGFGDLFGHKFEICQPNWAPMNAHKPYRRSLGNAAFKANSFEPQQWLLRLLIETPSFIMALMSIVFRRTRMLLLGTVRVCKHAVAPVKLRLLARRLERVGVASCNF